MSFSIRTFDFNEAGRRYKISLRVPQEKSLDDTMSWLAERSETSGVMSESFGPFDMVVRRVQ